MPVDASSLVLGYPAAARYNSQFNHHNPSLWYCSHHLRPTSIIIYGHSNKNSLHKHQVSKGAWSANQLLQTLLEWH
jgi:hypothetical protein